jgi:hypothetical protein
MTRPLQRCAQLAMLACCSVLTPGCADADFEADPDGAAEPLVVPGVVVEAVPPAPAGEPRVDASPNAVDAVAKVVQGVAEVRIDDKQAVPADYLRVALRGGRTAAEAFTSSTGEFFFEDVPAGSYELVFLTATKEARQVYATTVRIGPGAIVRLPTVHIPVDSVRTRRR